jgi:hypothetical protein
MEYPAIVVPHSWIALCIFIVLCVFYDWSAYMKRFVVRHRDETNWQAVKAYSYGAWKDLPKTASEAIKKAYLGPQEFRDMMVMEVTFKRVRKGKR